MPTSALPQPKLPQDQKFEVFLEAIRKSNELTAVEEEELKHETEIVDIAQEKRKKIIEGLLCCIILMTIMLEQK